MINSLSTDFLIRLKNSSLAGNKYVTAPNSKFVRGISDLLIKNGYIIGYEVSEDKKSLKVELAYDDDQPKISDVKLFSKSGRRWYEKAFTLPWGQSYDSLIIVSTSKGLLTQRQAKKAGIGGEIIAEIN
jgi:small subunit ribosomal protein S8